MEPSILDTGYSQKYSRHTSVKSDDLEGNVDV